MSEPHFEVHPWAVRARGGIDGLPTAEAVFSLGNGHVGLRGNLDEGEPAGVPGSYLNGFYETRRLPYAESAYGYPEDGQTLLNVPNGKIIRVLVDDEPFDMRYGTVHHHERTLDLRDGVLRREADWTSPSGQRVRLRTTRIVSFTHRAIAAFCFEIEPVDDEARIVVQSELVANEPIPEQSDDPRAAAQLPSPLQSEHHGHHELRAGFVHRTLASGPRVATAMDHLVEGPEETVTEAETDPDLARVSITTELAPGETLRVVKFLAYGWSSRRPVPAVRDQVEAALASARRTGWDGLLEDQRSYLDAFWHGADVEVDGDAELQQAIRFALFQLLQAGARNEGRAIPAKGLTGRGYDGHTFWDMEMFVLAALTWTAPDAAADALRWRHSTLDLAQARARELRLKGAAFPWRTIGGQECSGYWPAGTAAFHVNGGIAEAVRRLVVATADEEFERGPGIEMLVETARLWRSVGHHDRSGAFRIDGVTGPDEYSALADNNVYTNVVAARNLEAAAWVSERHPDRAAELGVDEEELASWRDAAEAVAIPYDPDLGVHPQAEGFTSQRTWHFWPEDLYPLLLHVPYYLLYSSQVVKQADLVFALYVDSERFSAEEKARNFAFYEAITVRDSSLSAPIQAVVAAETGHLDLALDYAVETALIDLHDLAGNTSDGLHLAALAGSWLALVAGFGGLRDHGEDLAFSPRLPDGLQRLAFRLLYRGRCLRVEILRGEASYQLMEGEPMTLRHHGAETRVTADEPVVLPVPPAPRPDPVQHPPDRPPRRRSGAS
jgi:alpha,alpha-trehalose phosphorylase